MIERHPFHVKNGKKSTEVGVLGAIGVMALPFGFCLWVLCMHDAPCLADLYYSARRSAVFPSPNGVSQGKLKKERNIQNLFMSGKHSGYVLPRTDFLQCQRGRLSTPQSLHMPLGRGFALAQLPPAQVQLQ